MDDEPDAFPMGSLTLDCLTRSPQQPNTINSSPPCSVVIPVCALGSSPAPLNKAHTLWPALLCLAHPPRSPGNIPPTPASTTAFPLNSASRQPAGSRLNAFLAGSQRANNEIISGKEEMMTGELEGVT
ncbi:hypothetical protein PTTG_28565 [Puccinia triticina 1-1 BBBD Race 1]|uniref:Uncharacterized protein n=1 Tax=Puccinia triticina (isolate 1-1 / race 1 (BBBD)) TaxID=630390 RepID=A0A180GAW3_PUCT1|nr:hypothetical protein PTTG_28565 [Puccinia triticina 1-1 BBBD Race 1]